MHPPHSRVRIGIDLAQVLSKVLTLLRFEQRHRDIARRWLDVVVGRVEQLGHSKTGGTGVGVLDVGDGALAGVLGDESSHALRLRLGLDAGGERIDSSGTTGGDGSTSLVAVSVPEPAMLAGHPGGELGGRPGVI
jgi:hypothetical protein